MGLILLEALLALFIFIAIVWWTMFSGRKKGELPQAQPDHGAESTPASPPKTSAAQTNAAEDTQR